MLTLKCDFFFLLFRVYTCVSTSSSRMSFILFFSWGVKEGFILFLQRAQHASFTYITTYAYNNNIKPFRCVFGRGRELCVCGALIIIFAIQRDLVIRVSCKGHIFTCVCVSLCVCMCETLCIFFSSVCESISPGLEWLQASEWQVWRWSFTRSSLTFDHR